MRLKASVAHSFPDVPFVLASQHQRLRFDGAYARARAAFKAARFGRLRLPANCAPLRDACGDPYDDIMPVNETIGHTSRLFCVLFGAPYGLNWRQAMAEAAEAALVGKGWFPSVLRAAAQG